MKICFWNEIARHRGPGIFLQNLKSSLARIKDVRIVEETQKPDINIIFIHGDCVKGARNVQRIDGVYYDRGRLKLNKPIIKTYIKAEAVVFQSNWSQRMFMKMCNMKEKKRMTVIHNGMNQSVFRKMRVDKKGFQKLFMACSHWRPNKRLQAIVDAFCIAHPKFKEPTGLCIVGQNGLKVKHPSILNFGKLSIQQAYEQYKSADYFVHISHLESCSNSVVEALSAGCPVLSNNIGSTKDVVKGDGIVLDIDKEFNFSPINAMEEVGSGSISVDAVSDGMLRMSNKKWEIKRPDLDISNVARKYYSFFVRLLDGK